MDDVSKILEAVKQMGMKQLSSLISEAKFQDTSKESWEANLFNHSISKSFENW